jgi:hypothetical protein
MVYWENTANLTSTLCRQNAEMFNVKEDGRQSYHCPLKDWINTYLSNTGLDTLSLYNVFICKKRNSGFSWLKMDETNIQLNILQHNQHGTQLHSDLCQCYVAWDRAAGYMSNTVLRSQNNTFCSMNSILFAHDSLPGPGYNSMLCKNRGNLAIIKL